MHRRTPRIPRSLPELLCVTSCMVAIQAAVWCLHIRIIRKNKHIACRRLVRWCWGSFGKDIRVPSPSCTVNCIWAERLECEYKGFHYADEYIYNIFQITLL